MTRRLQGRYPGPGWMFALSLGCHLALFLLIAQCRLLPAFHPQEAPVTYVDMVTLPVASPQSGTPTQETEAAPEPPAAAAPPAPASPPAALVLPRPAPKAQAKAQVPAAPKEQVETPDAGARETRAFSERLAKIERLAEERRQAAVLDRLRNKGGRTGMPGAKGTEAGSDYSSYLQSRLQDALRQVIASQTRSPQVIATITVGPQGLITEYQVEKHSGDPLFDEAVARAVTLAGRSLQAPPGGTQFKGKFRFRPEEVGVR